jgi:hypothetical protein
MMANSCCPEATRALKGRFRMILLGFATLSKYWDHLGGSIALLDLVGAVDGMIMIALLVPSTLL